MPRSKQTVGPTWEEVMAAFNAQQAQFMDAVEKSEARLGQRIEAVLTRIDESNNATREWVKVLKDSADKEHAAMRTEAASADKAIKEFSQNERNAMKKEYRTGFAWVWAVIGPFLLFLFGLLGMFIYQELGLRQ